jgi:hypothetical protein
MPSSGLWRRVDIVLADVSEERIASIFRTEEKKKKIRKQSTSVSSTYNNLRVLQ